MASCRALLSCVNEAPVENKSLEHLLGKVTRELKCRHGCVCRTAVSSGGTLKRRGRCKSAFLPGHTLEHVSARPYVSFKPSTWTETLFWHLFFCASSLLRDSSYQQTASLAGLLVCMQPTSREVSGRKRDTAAASEEKTWLWKITSVVVQSPACCCRFSL